MANINPTGIDELEEKKWLISRIILQLQSVIDEFNSIHEQVEKIEKTEKESITGRRNSFLSPTGVFLTIILALYSTGKINDNLFLISLFSTIVFGAVVYFLSIIYLRTTSNVFTHIENAITDSIQGLSMALGFINIRVAQLDSISTDFLLNYITFVNVLGSARIMAHKNEYDEGRTENFLIGSTKNTLKINADEYQKLFERIIDNLNSIIASYTPDKEIPESWYEEAKSLIKSYKKKSN